MNTPPPEITDPLLKSLVEEAAALPRKAALEARNARNARARTRTRSPESRPSRRSFNPWGGVVWLMQFRVAQAAIALLIFAALVECGAVLSGERTPFAQKKGVDLLTAATVTTKSGQQSVIPVTTTADTDEAFSGSSPVIRNGSATAVASPLITFTGALSAPDSLNIASGTVTTVTPNWVAAQSGGADRNTNGYYVADSGSNANTSINHTFGINSLNFTGTESAVTVDKPVVLSGSIANSGASSESVLDNGVASVKLGDVSPDLNGQSVTKSYTGPQLAFTGGSGTGGTVSGNAVLGSDKTWTLPSAPTSPLTVNGQVTMAGSGTHILTGAETYTGTTTITGGATVQLSNGNADGSVASATQNSGTPNQTSIESKFVDIAQTNNKDLNFDYSLGTGNIGNIHYSGGNTTSPTTTFPFTNLFGGGQVASGIRSGGQAGVFDGGFTDTRIISGTVSNVGVSNGSGTFAGTITNNLGTVEVTKSSTGTTVLSGGSLTPDSIISGTTIHGIGRIQPGIAGAPIKAGTQGTDLFDPGRVEAVNVSDSKIGGPLGPKSLTDLSTSAEDIGFNFASTYYSRGILQGPQGKGGDWNSLTSRGQTVPIHSGTAWSNYVDSITQLSPRSIIDRDRFYSDADGYFFTGTLPKNTQSGVLVTGTVASHNPKTLAEQSGSASPAGGKPAIPAPAATPAPVIDTRKLIRNAALDFEVGSFEKALDIITQVAGEEQGYVFSQNSAKGANGKLQGQIVVKVLPPNLDRFLLKLRLLGDMRNQTVSAVDVSKDYFDTEARIRNAQVTEERLIEMMKTRTGKVSDLLEVENEIAKVRGEIEQMQGSLKVYDAQVQFATVVISIEEKDIDQAAAYLLVQQSQLSIFAKDVEQAFEDAKSAADDAKAQTLDSHVERDQAGHVIATLHLLIPPENAPAAIAKLKEIGRIEHFNSQTQRIAKGDSGGRPSDTAKVDRDKVELTMTIQHDAENAVQGTNIAIQSDQVEEKTAEIKQQAAKEGVEVKGAEFNRMRNGVEISAMLLRMPLNKYSTFIEEIKALGKVKDFTVSRREDATAGDDAPAEIVLQIFSQGSIVAPDTGLWATVRHTLGEGTAALMWSLRMIGVSLAFVAPWAVVAGIAGWIVVMRRRRKARKQG